MKRLSGLTLSIICTILFLGTSQADTSITGYGTYWNGEDTGIGAGVRYKKTFLGFGAAEARGGYVSFEDTKTEIAPVDVSINARLPFFISPYLGIGAGYNFVTSENPLLDKNTSGTFAQFGVEATLVLVGVMAEVRYYEGENDYLDGAVGTIGILIKW